MKKVILLAAILMCAGSAKAEGANICTPSNSKSSKILSVLAHSSNEMLQVLKDAQREIGAEKIPLGLIITCDDINGSGFDYEGLRKSIIAKAADISPAK